MNWPLQVLKRGILLFFHLQFVNISAFYPSSISSGFNRYNSNGSNFSFFYDVRGDCRNIRVSTGTFLSGSTCRKIRTRMGAKGDGKQRRDKRIDAPSLQVPSSSTPIPQRVSNDINIPVRHQIKFAQMKKAVEKESSSNFRQNNAKRTAYRKSLGLSQILNATDFSCYFPPVSSLLFLIFTFR